MTRYYSLRPEVAGELGDHTVLDTTVHPPVVSTLHYEFVGWFGDQLVEVFPCYLVSESLAAAFAQHSLTGFSERAVEVSTVDEFTEMSPVKELPRFRWLHIAGVRGKDDFYLAPPSRLVVSQRALEIILSTHPVRLTVTPLES